MSLKTKADKRQHLSKMRPEISSCRGGIRMILTGKNTRGKETQITVFLDNSFIPGVVGDIVAVVDKKASEAIALRNRLKNIVHGEKETGKAVSGDYFITQPAKKYRPWRGITRW